MCVRQVRSLDAFDIQNVEKPFASKLITCAEKDRIIQRGIHGYYRWYIDRSAKRNWNPDRSLNWRAFGRTHSEELISLIEGFYAVEQYAPDYTIELTRQSRASCGRSQFQLHWGAEEQRHADLWRNVLLFSRHRTIEQVERYTDKLRTRMWTPPFHDSLQMLLYALFQERATQLIYTNLAKVARGESDAVMFAEDADPVLAEACRLIACDEAAHYDFFLQAARLHLYYQPEETLCALVDVLRNFVMPAAQIVPNYDAFVKALYESRIFGRLMYARDVVPAALAQLGIDNIRVIERAIRSSTCEVSGSSGASATFEEICDASTIPGLRFPVLESTVRCLFERLSRYEDEIGLAAIRPTVFIQNQRGSKNLRRA